ncbi:hypothetical protein FHX74_002186 [Friedmanniella endophytica]|uniref:Phytase-like domain-containing protein n=1 Tax=Microlunatus kandeliicorticis TaxID=1759536 RepID=A0A7W3ISS1_9ACTN|nr:esterase-like activity of phytase family protein [Microlunatus kandeliicorticis]MBA8794567.1 hypothetical protein [Microlunatus kandeliicorticis]
MTDSSKRRIAAGALALGLAASLATTTAPAAPATPARMTSMAQRPPGTVSLRVFTEQVPRLATFGGVAVDGDGFGSAVAPVPGHRDEVYGLTDRGPNVDGPDGSKIEPLPDFTPAIGRFRLRDGRAELLQRIPLRAADGTPYNGRVNSQASTGETITDLDGHVLTPSPYGYDSEGLVALRDGTFWVSDEYGPFITHLDRRGRAIARLSPYDGSLPAELARRTPNRGMEGLTITPDGRTLVGIMQSALTQPDAGKPKKVAVTRIVTVDLRSHRTHEYAFVLDDPSANDTAVSEITALSATRFLVDERDGAFGPGAYKKLWEVDLRGATDIGPRSTVGHYDATNGGLLVDGRTVEAIAGTGDVATTTAALRAAGITPVSQKLRLDLGALTDAVDPDGGFFDHDKIEGVAVLDHGRTLIVSNDSDFGLGGSTGTTAPFGLVPKTTPQGGVDRGQFLEIRFS